MDTLNANDLTALSDHLATRREVILQAWRGRAEADPAQTTVSVLTRSQFEDHIPQMLEASEWKLRSRPGSRNAAAANEAKTAEEMKHGLQRWQQGYRLKELMHEWGHLHVCLAAEVKVFAASRPEMESEVLAAAYQALVELISEGVNESVGQYHRLQQAEAAGLATDLQSALKKLNDLDRGRSELMRQAVHDLRTNVQSASIAADVLREKEVAEIDRVEFAKMIQEGLEAVAVMLGDLMTLSRLDAGQERRILSTIDAGKLVMDLCVASGALATERKLFLKLEGPPSFEVEGDAGKVRRILQNLIFNALKYTDQGGVTVRWGDGDEEWWVLVKDTGAGLMAGPSAPLVAEMKEATSIAREADATVTPADEHGAPPIPRPQRAGEGIGLSIVKRLCDLLDARLEVVTSVEKGTSFRIVFPRHYGASQRSVD